jgi:hypothetical protein
MVAGGLVWLSAVVWLITSNAIAREIRPIGAIAELLDKLPTAVSAPIFIVLWFVFLLGWILLVIFGVRPLITRRSNSQRP